MTGRRKWKSQEELDGGFGYLGGVGGRRGDIISEQRGKEFGIQN